MGKLIKELNNTNIKPNITAVYSSKQSENILKLLNKNSKMIILIFAGQAADMIKIQFQNLKKVIITSMF